MPVLSPEEAAALGLPVDASAPAPARKTLSAEEAKALGLPDTRAPAQVSGALAFGRGAAQGAQLGFGDEIEGAVQAVGRKLLPESWGGGGEADKKKPLGQIYRESRDVARREYKDAEKAHPGLYLGGQLVGGLAPSVAAGAALAPMTMGARAAPAWSVSRGAKMADALKVGTALGTAGAVGASDAEDPLAVAQDAAKGGALGLGLSVAAPVVGAAVGAAARGAGRLLREKAIEQGRRVLMGGAQSLSRKAPVSEPAVQEALDSAIRPLGTTKGTAERLAGELDTVGDQYGRIVTALEGHGIEGPDAQALAQKIVAEGRSVGQRTLNRAVPKVYADAAEDLAHGTTYPGAPAQNPGRLSLSRTEDLKRSQQRMAAYDKQAPADVNDARKDVASMLRQATEDEIAQQTPAAGPVAEAIGSQFVPTKLRYGLLAEAEKAAVAGAQQAGRRSGPNLTDTIHTAAMMARHGSAGLLMSPLSRQWRLRGPSTMAWGADRSANVLDALIGSSGAPPSRTRALIEALRNPALGSAAETGGEHIAGQ